jgi:hypothetical protein
VIRGPATGPVAESVNAGARDGWSCKATRRRRQARNAGAGEAFDTHLTVVRRSEMLLRTPKD